MNIPFPPSSSTRTTHPHGRTQAAAPRTAQILVPPAPGLHPPLGCCPEGWAARGAGRAGRSPSLKAHWQEGGKSILPPRCGTSLCIPREPSSGTSPQQPFHHEAGPAHLEGDAHLEGIWRETHIWREMPAYSRCSWSREQPYPHATGIKGMDPSSCPICTAPWGQHRPTGRNICRFARSQVQVCTPQGGNKRGGINAQRGIYHGANGMSNAARSHFPQAHRR